MQKQAKQVRYRSYGQLILITLNLCLSLFYYGYSVAYFSTIDFVILIDIFGINMQPSTAQGFLTGCIPVGAGIGAMCSYFLIKYLSRRNCLLCVNVFAILVGGLIMVQDLYTLIFARIGQGLCVGFYSCVIPLFIKQLVPNQVSGSLGAFTQASISFGVFFSFLFEFILSQIFTNDEPHYWYIVFGFTIVTALLQSCVLLFVFPYQTPKYLLLKNQQDKARQLIRILYKNQYVEQVLREKKQDIYEQKFRNQSDQARNFKTNQNMIDYQDKAQESSIKANLLHKQQKMWLPKIIVLHLSLLKQFVGINVVVAYGPPIANEAMPTINSSIIPMILNLEQIIGALTCSYLLSRFGRRQLIQTGCLIVTFALLIISLGFYMKPKDETIDTAATVLIVTGLVSYMANFGLTIGPVSWLYIPEVVQPFFIPYATLANWIGASITMILFPILKDVLQDKNPAPLFLFFALWALFSYVVNLKFMIETKGKTEQQIIKEYVNLQGKIA